MSLRIPIYRVPRTVFRAFTPTRQPDPFPRSRPALKCSVHVIANDFNLLSSITLRLWNASDSALCNFIETKNYNGIFFRAAKVCSVSLNINYVPPNCLPLYRNKRVSDEDYASFRSLVSFTLRRGVCNFPIGSNLRSKKLREKIPQRVENDLLDIFLLKIDCLSLRISRGNNYLPYRFTALLPFVEISEKYIRVLSSNQCRI